MTTPEPQSPCIRSCTLDDNDMCIGCFRTLQEIIGWSSYSAEEKQSVLSGLEERKAEYERKYGRWNSPRKDWNR